MAVMSLFYLKSIITIYIYNYYLVIIEKELKWYSETKKYNSWIETYTTGFQKQIWTSRRKRKLEDRTIEGIESE